MGVGGAGGGVCAHCGLPVPIARRQAEGGDAFCCFGCALARELSRPSDPAGLSGRGSGTLVIRLGLGIFLTLNLMAFGGLNLAGALFGGADEPGRAALEGLFAYLQMFLATGVLAVLGGPLALDSLWSHGRLRPRLDANLLILIGVAAAFALSALHTLGGAGPLYFDTMAMILLLVTLGHYLESRARMRAVEAAQALLASAPTRAFVDRAGRVEEVAAESVRPGERVRVRAGEVVPVDGRLVEGACHLDERLLTGESAPRPAGPGERALAGSVSLDGQVWVEAERTGEDRVLARTARLLDEARAEQPPVQRMADRVAAVFVPAVVALALAVGLWHGLAGDAERGIFDALSVLLISCPCALGLAAPLASHFALARAARLGILIDSAATLERLASVRRVLLDKTGTLTEERLTLDRVEPLAGLSRAEALRLAGALEATSLHPVGHAIHEVALAELGALPAAHNARTLPGLGVSGTVGGRELWLGSPRLAAERGLAEAAAAGDDRAGTEVLLLDHERILARFSLGERLREDALPAVRALSALGVEAGILSGDRPGPAGRVAAALGIGFEAGLLPADKLDRLRRERAGGRRGGVAMVGDGINDAPILAAADVGFALQSGADLARQAGNVRLLGDRLERVPRALALGRSAMRSIRLNLAWAFLYNLVGVGLAAAGALNPVVAALAMLLSSLFVIHTSRGAGSLPGMEEAAA